METAYRQHFVAWNLSALAAFVRKIFYCVSKLNSYLRFELLVKTDN